VREGRLELPRPLGHRILRLLGLRTDSACPCRPVPSGVVSCRRMSSCREQDVSKRGQGVMRARTSEMVSSGSAALVTPAWSSIAGQGTGLPLGILVTMKTTPQMMNTM
jgi:hypothetical protein